MLTLNAGTAVTNQEDPRVVRQHPRSPIPGCESGPLRPRPTVPTSPCDLVHSQCRHLAQISTCQPPVDGVLHRPADAIPRGAENRIDLAPAQPLGRSRKIPSVRNCQMVLAVTPRHHLDGHTTTLAVHSWHPVGQEDQKPPQRDELKPLLHQAIGRGTRKARTGTEHPTVLSRHHLNDEAGPLMRSSKATSP